MTSEKDATVVPILYVGYNNITLYENQSQIITPQIINVVGANASLGYTVTVKPVDVVNLNVVSPIINKTPASTNTYGSYAYNSSTKLYTPVTYFSSKGYSFEIIAKPLPTGVSTKTCTITIAGNESGGQISINVTVIKI
jgi:hypothetical protein